MKKNRDNCLLLIVEPLEDSKLRKELTESFGMDEAKNIYKELLSLIYKKVKNYDNAIPIISYAKTAENPDLTWLDADDPGFVEYSKSNQEERIREIFKLAFFAGAKKAILIDTLTPDINDTYFDKAFEAINENTAALGRNDDGSFYLLGFTQPNLKVLDTPGFTFSKSGEILYDRFKKAKLSVFETQAAFAVKNNDELKRWKSEKKAQTVKKPKENQSKEQSMQLHVEEKK